MSKCQSYIFYVYPNPKKETKGKKKGWPEKEGFLMFSKRKESWTKKRN